MPNSSNQLTPNSAVRLIFEYEGDQVHLVSQQPVDMAITGFDIARTEIAGYYIDTRDSNGRTLARVPAREAFSASTEVFPEKPNQPIVRVDMAQAKGAFTVVIPAPKNANHVSVVHVAPPPITAETPTSRTTSLQAETPTVTELAQFPLQIKSEKGERP